VTRQEIGRIRILGRETQFEVAPYAAARFAAAARRAEGEDAHIRIEPMQPVKAPPRRPRMPPGEATRRRP
jgi:ATP-dependent RNA helicase DeaD